MTRLRLEKDLHLAGADITGEPVRELDRFLQIDPNDPMALANVVADESPDLVFHLAGANRGTAGNLERINVTTGMELLVKLADTAPRVRVLLAGSAAEYGPVQEKDLPVREELPCRPTSPYGISKHSLVMRGLEFAHARGMHVTVARAFNIIGAGIPPSLVVGAVLKRLKEALAAVGEPVVRVGNLGTRRDFVSVEDAVDAYWRMLNGPFAGQIFNVCSGHAVKIADLVSTLIGFAPRPVRLETDPALVRPDDVPVMYGDPTKARHAFGFEPETDITPALRRAYAHIMDGPAR